MTDLVSVIIPTYKGSTHLGRAIESLLNQTYENIEIIVVDDNDPGTLNRQQTELVMSNYSFENIKYIKHDKNRNGAFARNTGIKYSEGKYICFLDDDDFYLPERIKKSVDILENNTKYQAVYCSVIITNNKKFHSVTSAEKILKSEDILLNEMVIGTGSNIFFKKKILDVLEGFDVEFKRNQDVEFLLRLSVSFYIININEVLIVKASNFTSNSPSYVDFLNVKELFENKFKFIINQLSDSKKQIFYKNKYRILLNIAIASGNKEYIKEASEALNSVAPLNLREKMLILLVLNNIIGKNGLVSIKKCYNNFLNASYHFKLYKLNISDDYKDIIIFQLKKYG